MGAAGSSNGATSTSMPFRERSRETFIYGTEESRCPEYANENIRQRTRTSTFDVGEEPRSQGPSPYSTLRGEEWWNQRPSAPSLSNLRPPGQETLLTYAAQMTGWQTAEGNSPSFSRQHQEAMELSKVISQLAMANQQLASAHSTTLAHLEALYVELKKEKESRRRTAPSNELDEALKRRFTMEEKRDDENEEEQKRTIETRIDRLERQLSDNWDGCHNRQRNVRQGDDRRLRSRIEGLETMMKVKDLDRETERSRLTSAHDGEKNQTNNAECNDRLLNNSYILGDELKNRIFKPRSGTRFSKNVTCEDEPDDATTSHGEINSFVSNLHLEKSEREECDRTVIEQVQNVDRNEIIRLLDEIDRLRSEKSNYQYENERLTKELAEQKSMATTLKKDYMESKTRHEQVECNLRERREEYEKLMAKFEDATKETERLLKEIDAVNLERESAESRISSLEKDLQKSRIEKEVIVTAESQKASKLKAQLSEEVSDKKKQIKALEDALDEIQRLKETMKTEKNEEVDDGSKENAVESRENSQENVSPEGTTNLEDFKKELFMKREARQRAIAAVSSEMERLRRELDAEKEAHSETSRVLDLLRSAQNEAQAREQTNSMNESWKASKTKEQKTDECDLDEQRTEARRLASILKVSDELKNDIRIQIDKLDDLRYQLETEPEQHRYRIRSLSELANRTREAVYTRERRSSNLKDHLAESLLRFGDRSYLEVKDDVGQECERQLENMNSLKSLYNERLKVLNELKETAVKELVDTKSRLDHAMKKCECLEEDLSKADEKIDVQDTQISNLESQLGLTKADCRDLQNQMSLINGLFTQMLLGATSADMDLDRLTQLLQENHDLICDMAREEGTEAAALPKLLLDLIEQVEGSKGPQKRIEGENPAESETEKKEDDLQQEDIAHNLPKVWRVLLELLSCHAEGTPSASAASSSSDPNICYKSVDTPAGPRLVISVSKTYIRLKELILEKKHLEKEMNRMKQLNTHLESKLGEQEKRLSAVSAELSKTWLIVDRMQAQHQQLHTHEKILRYELQQKRKMLQELKQELEYCREKWESARQKNTNTEIEWRSLRREFAARKAIAVHDSFSNSAESGFSDERGDDTDDEDNAVEDRIRLGPRRRSRKENPRAPTPDTESEQPTDTELSEPKIECLETSEERTPTPETEAELDEMEVTDGSLNSNFANDSETPQLIPESPQESMNPLDQALTNVIQNLIGMDDNIRSTSESFLTLNDRKILGMLPNTDSVSEDPHTAQSLSENLNLSFVKDTGSSEIAAHDHVKEVSILPSVQENNRLSTITEDQENSTDSAGEKIKITNDESLRSSFVSPVPSGTSATVTQSVFSIGPFVTSDASSQPSIVKNVQFSEPLIVGPSNQFFAPVFGATLSNESFTPSFASSTNVETDLKEKSVSKMTETAMDSDDISVESSSSLDTVKDFSPANTPSTSSSDPLKSEEKKILVKNRTPEEALAAREDRLKRLEEQAKWLMNKMSATNRRGSALSTRLEELHEVYGEPPVPPPMPDVLPSRRLRTNLSDLPQQVPESSTTEDSKNTETKTNESPPSETP